ncbi:MAG: hypothetical protein HYZ53_02895 [Planctomycetes bacterium]|nr:hypothetical protein [Planctomycetota bacterium]
MPRTRPRLAAALLLPLLPVVAAASGCKMNRFIANQMTSSLQDQTLAFEREPNVRHAREAGPALLKMLDGFLVSSPENPELLVAAARMNTTFAFALIEEEDEAWARDLYKKGRGYGEKLLQRWPGMKERLGKGGPELEAALRQLGAEELPVLFWTAYSWGSAINLLRNSPESIADLPSVQALMHRVMELDPTYYHGGPHLFLGVTYGARSKALGGDLVKSKEHFEKALALTQGKFLLTYVLYARFYCVQAQDRALFLKLLNGVVKAPADLDPEQALANAIAKRRAAKLLTQVDDLILPDVPEEPAK